MTVLFDCHLSSRRVFAAAVPLYFSRDDALFMAKVDPMLQCQVFHRDVPWPIPDGYWIYPSDGDWIGIYLEGCQPGPLPDLHQYLRGEIPTYRADIGFWDSDIAWVLSDGPQTAAPIPEDSFAVNSAQAAEALCLHPGRFVLLPAAPELSDHSHCGTPSRRVLLAKQIGEEDDASRPEQERTPYILDLRPVQLPLCQVSAPEGVVDVSEVCQRLLHRCPRGFHVRLYGGAFDDDIGNHFRRVRAGEILSAEFHPDFVREVVSQLEPGTFSSGTSLSDSHRSAQDLPSGSASSAFSGSADAGTGGSLTHHGDAGRQRRASGTQGFLALARTGSKSLTDKWSSTFSSVHAILHGKVSPTPVGEALCVYRCPRVCLHRLRCKPTILIDAALCRPIHQPPLTPHRLASAAFSAILLAVWWATIPATICLPVAVEGILFFLLTLAVAKCRRVGFLGFAFALLVLGSHNGVLGVQLPRRESLGTDIVLCHGGSCPDHMPVRETTNTMPPCPRAVRPLPTPCRAGRTTDNLAHDWRHAEVDVPPSDALRTLLEISCNDQAGYPYYLAATLLDVLCTHLESPAGPRPVLCLQELVPPPAHTSSPTAFGDFRLSSSIPTVPFPLPSALFRLDGSAEVQIGTTPLGFSLDMLEKFLSSSAHLLNYDALCRACSTVEHISLTSWPAIFQEHRHLVPPTGILVYTDGSFTPRSETPAKAGWATIFVDPGHATLSAAFGPVIGFPTEDLVLSPYVAECYALMAAALISTVAFHDRPLVFLSDCVAAVGVAAGSMTFQSGGVAQATASAHHMRRQLCSNTDCYKHIPGHRGIAGNELADRASKAGANQEALFCGLNIGPAVLEFWLSHGAKKLPWATTVVCSLRGDAGLPPINCIDVGNNLDHANLRAVDLIQPFVPEGVFDAQVRSGASANAPEAASNGSAVGYQQFVLRAATFNVLSLGKPKDAKPDFEVTQGLAYQPARAALLADQLLTHNIQVAFLQETRADPGATRIGKFLRFASGANRGQFGTEIWVRDQHEVLAYPDHALPGARFDKTSLVVVYSDVHRLFLRFSSNKLSLLLVALHSPHRATENSIISTWWQQTNSLLLTHRRQSCLVIGGDLNASLGGIVSNHVQGVSPEDEDLPGSWVHDIAKRFDLFVPATFPECHSGQTYTYTQKNGGHRCRPDFVLVPLAWAKGHVSSWCEPAIQAGHSTPDHVAACVGICFWSLWGPGEAKLSKRRIRAEDICAPENRNAVAEVLRSVPRVPWGVSVHAHAAIVTKHVQDGLQRITGPRAVRPHHAYLTDATWQMQRDVSKLRRHFHQLSHRIQLCDLAAGFYAWARGSPLRKVLLHGCRWHAQAERARQSMHIALTEQCKQLRKACRRDRDAYIGRLAETISVAPSKESFAAYHAILAHRRKKVCSPDPLPQVLDLSGEVCPDAPSMQQRWREHFACLEGGQETTFWQLAERAASGALVSPSLHPPDIADVPSLPDLCKVLAATKVGKASGMDSIPAEINRAFTQDVASLLFPLLLKTLWRGAEPAGYKGGQAVIMYKGRGQASACTSYRSILLMNTWAKTLHQSVRPLIRDVFEQTAPALQIGGRSGCSVTFGSHILRGVFRCAHQNSVPAFVLFADISAAFYSALVQLVAHSPATTSTEGLQTALQGLALPDDVVDELRELLQQPSALSQSSASPWLERLAAHFGERNWFVIAGDSTPIATGRGTRPGSSWADVLFALLMPKVLRKRDDILATLGATPTKPQFLWDGVQSLDPCAEGSPLTSVDEVVWADDIAVPRLCPQVSCMERAVRVETTALTEAFLSFGFRLAFGEHKTAAVVSVCGSHSRAVKRSLYSHEGLQGQLPVLFEHIPAMKLPLPPKYKHLGVLQTPTGSILEEIRHRAGLARGTYHEARRKVYKSKAISLQRKATLLATTVIPKLLQGAGAWPPLNKREHQAFAGAIWGFYRGVLGVHRNMDQRITASTCFSLLQLPDPDTLLKLARLSYLSQIIRSGPDILWAILRADRPYATMLESDLAWLYAWVWDTCSLPHPNGNWPAWHSFIKTSPNRFKGLCKRARALVVCQHTVIAALDNLHCALTDIAGARPHTSGALQTPHTELCLPCKRSFPSRVSWAGHAARCHGYRSRSFLLPEDRVCRTCAKVFATIGRLRRHLVSAPRCLTGWGIFQPSTAARKFQPHAMAPPTIVPGETAPPPNFDFSPTISTTLLHALQELSGCPEDEVWEVLESHIEPLQTLRDTVLRWRDDGSPSLWRTETADNMLLLLDPDVVAESRQPTTEKSGHLPAHEVAWTALGRLPLSHSGQPVVKRLESPPPHVMHHCRPHSLTVRQASAYAAWLEAACDMCANCALTASQHPVAIRCPGLSAALGPASQWLIDCGFDIQSHGLFSGP